MRKRRASRQKLVVRYLKGFPQQNTFDTLETVMKSAYSFLILQ